MSIVKILKKIFFFHVHFEKNQYRFETFQKNIHL